MRIGILGPGKIADTVADTLERMPEAECYAVASRDRARAEAFKEKHGFQIAYGSYGEMLSDPKVELVYIATPHVFHAEQMLTCIAYRKPVLCEKPFTINAKEAEEVQRAAKAAGVFAAEAIWPRYMPSRKMVREAAESGTAGHISALTANLFYPVGGVERMKNPLLGGGALLDVGVYSLNFALMAFGNDIVRVDSSMAPTEAGVDAMNSVTLHYADGRMAFCSSGMVARSDRKGILFGDKGYIIVENINNPQSVSVFDMQDRLISKAEVPEQISGYEYQFRECFRAISEGKTEAPSMPLSESVFVMKLMDDIRRQWGLVYPSEQE